MFLLKRVRDILLRPAQTWQTIRTERSDAGWVFSTYVMPLAAVAALAVFVGLTVVGVGDWESRQRLPLSGGLAGLGIGFLLALLVIYVTARAVNALASSFGARQSPRRSMMLVGYASTAAFVGALFALVPALAFIGLLFALYSVYLLYTGLPVLMKCPPQKVVAYTALSGAVAVLTIGSVAAALMLILSPGRPGATADAALAAVAAPAAPMSIAASAAAAAEVPAPPESPQVAEMTRSMTEAQGRFAAARMDGNAPAAAAALAAMKQAITQHQSQGLDPQVLKLALPLRFSDGRSQVRVSTHTGQGGDVLGGSEVQATYAGTGQPEMQLALLDLGPRALLLKTAEWAQGADADAAPGHVDKIAKEGPRTRRELFRPAASHAQVTLVLANGIIVEARADKSDLPTVRKLLTEVDLGTLEMLKRGAVP